MRDLHLVRHGQGEELGARGGQLIEQLRGHAVAGHVEEAAVPARRLDLLGHAATARAAALPATTVPVPPPASGATSTTGSAREPVMRPSSRPRLPGTSPVRRK